MVAGVDHEVLNFVDGGKESGFYLCVMRTIRRFLTGSGMI